MEGHRINGKRQPPMRLRHKHKPNLRNTAITRKIRNVFSDDVRLCAAHRSTLMFARFQIVIFPGKYFHSLAEITGDIGAREVLKKDKQSINYFATKRKSYFLDLDTPEEWSSWTYLNKK